MRLSQWQSAIALGLSTLGSVGMASAAWSQTLPDLPPYPPTVNSPDVAPETTPQIWQPPLPVPRQATPPVAAPTERPPDHPTIRAIDFLPESRELDSSSDAETAQQMPPSTSSQPSPRYKPKGLSFYIASRVPNPTAAQGPTRTPVTRAGSDIRAETNATVGAQYVFNDRERIAAEARGGIGIFGLYFGYLQTTESPRSGFGINGFNQRSRSIALEGGEEVELPGGDEAWIHRTGGGIQGYVPVGGVDTSIGVNYQVVSVRDDSFSSEQEPVDEFGNPLTLSDSGEDELLTINVVGEYDSRDRTEGTTSGSRIRVGLDQSIPVGEANIGMTRLSASATEYIPLSLLRFTDDADTLILNLEGGHIFGDAPFYEAFSLGGANSVRGYSRGDIATGSSYVQATAEYRFPIIEIAAFDQGIDLGGTLFFDYGSALGSQDDVFGEPGVVRDKPGEGFGFGGGVRATFADITGRLEFGISDDGDANVYFLLGDRF